MEKKPTMFRGTSYTHCHKSAASYHVVIPKCKDVGEMTNDNPVNVRELLNIMSGHVLLSKLETIQKIFSSIMADEYSNITNKQQFSFFICTVDNN